MIYFCGPYHQKRQELGFLLSREETYQKQQINSFTVDWLQGLWFTHISGSYEVKLWKVFVIKTVKRMVRLFVSRPNNTDWIYVYQTLKGEERGMEKGRTSIK